ncbi:MAG: flagellar basal body-associated protein FliL, partial [Candidatus Azotimanducaceae bacterium]
MKRLLLILASVVCCSQELLAESDTQYVRLTKAMVINYGEPSLSRLKYMKVAVDVRVPTASAADLVEYHIPALLDAVVTVFS